MTPAATTSNPETPTAATPSARTGKSTGGRPHGWEPRLPPKLARSYFTLRQAARELGCSIDKVRKHIKQGDLIREHFGQYVMIPRTSVEFLIATLSGDASQLAPQASPATRSRSPRSRSTESKTPAKAQHAKHRTSR